MNLKESLKEIGKYGSIYMLGWVFNTILRLGLLPVYTRYLDRAEYGTLSILDSAIALIKLLCAMGLRVAIIRFFHEKQDIDYQRRVISTGLSIILFTVIISGVLLFPFSNSLSTLILGKGSNPIYCQLVLGTMLLGLFRIGADSYLTATKRARIFVFSMSGQMILNAAINLYLVIGLGMGVLGMLIGNLIASLIVNLGLFVYVVNINGLSIDKQLVKGMLRYGLPLVPSLWAAAGMHNLDRFFIRNYAGLEEVGLYSLAYQFPFMLNALFAYAFGSIWGGSTKYHIARSPDATYQYGRVCTYYMIALTFALFVISLCADVLISIFAAPSYFSAHRYLPIIALGVWAYSLHTFVKIGVELTKKTYLFTISYILALLLNIVLNILFVPRWGAMGAAWATVVTYFSFSMGGYLLYRHCYPIKLEWKRIFKLLIISVVLVIMRQTVHFDILWKNILFEMGLIALFPLIILVIRFFTKGEMIHIENFMKKIIFRQKIANSKT